MGEDPIPAPDGGGKSAPLDRRRAARIRFALKGEMRNMQMPSTINAVLVLAEGDAIPVKSLTDLCKTTTREQLQITVLALPGLRHAPALKELHRAGIIRNLWFLSRPVTKVSAYNIGWSHVPSEICMHMEHGVSVKNSRWLRILSEKWSRGLPLSVLCGTAAQDGEHGAAQAARDGHEPWPLLRAGAALRPPLLLPRGVLDIVGGWTEDYADMATARKDLLFRLSLVDLPVYCHGAGLLAPEDAQGQPGSETLVHGFSAEELFGINCMLHEIFVKPWKSVRRYVLDGVDRDHVAHIRERSAYVRYTEVFASCLKAIVDRVRNSASALPGRKGPLLDDVFVKDFKEKFERLDSGDGACSGGNPAVARVEAAGGEERNAPLYRPDAPPATEVVEQALLMPFLGSMDSFLSGVFVNGACLPAALMDRGRERSPTPPQERIRGTCFFGGYLFPHYGHFLLESLSRLHGLPRNADCPILFMSPRDQVSSWQKQVFSLLGIANEIVLIKKPTLADRLIVSSPASDPHQPMLDVQWRRLGQFPAQRVIPGKKVWISRSARNTGKVREEAALEKVLASDGWEIVHPERLDIADQLRLLCASRHVAGFDGSAFYSVLLCQKLTNHFTLFSRRNLFIPVMLDYIRKRGATLATHMFAATSLGGAGGGENFSLDVEQVIAALRQDTGHA